MPIKRTHSHIRTCTYQIQPHSHTKHRYQTYMSTCGLQALQAHGVTEVIRHSIISDISPRAPSAEQWVTDRLLIHQHHACCPPPKVASVSQYHCCLIDCLATYDSQNVNFLDTPPWMPPTAQGCKHIVTRFSVCSTHLDLFFLFLIFGKAMSTSKCFPKIESGGGCWLQRNWVPGVL